MNKLTQRGVIMLISIIVTNFTLSRFAIVLQQFTSFAYDWKFELCMVAGQLLFQLPFLYKKPLAVKFDYSYKLLLVSLMGSVLLLPLIAINHFYAVSYFANLCYFFVVVLSMFFVHKRIVAQLQLPGYMSYTWILYRCIILIFIF